MVTRPALDQGAEGGVGEVEGAEVGDLHASPNRSEFGQQGGLVRIELGEPRLWSQDRDSLQAAGVALFGYSFPDKPLLFDHPSSRPLLAWVAERRAEALAGSPSSR